MHGYRFVVSQPKCEILWNLHFLTLFLILIVQKIIKRFGVLEFEIIVLRYYISVGGINRAYITYTLPYCMVFCWNVE